MTTQSSNQEEAKKIWAQLEAEDAGTAMPPEANSSQGESQQDTAQAVSQAADNAQSQVDDDPALLRDEVAGLKSMLSQLTSRLRNAEGHIGGLNSAVKQQIQAAHAAKESGAAAPTVGEIQTAQASPQAMADLERDYPEFAKALKPVLETSLAAQRAELEKRIPRQQEQQEVVTDVVTKQELEVFRAEQRVEAKHSGWQQRVAQPEFQGWLSQAPREVRMLAGSNDPEDAIRLLDLHEEARKKPPVQQNRNITSAAAMPTGQRSAVRTKNVDEMSPQEYWLYLDQLDKQKV
jgi:hypothetical protein